MPSVPPCQRRSSCSGDHMICWRDFVPAAALLLVGLAALLIATISPSGKAGQYAVIVPPGQAMGEVMAVIQQAGGGILEMRDGSYFILAHSENPDFVSKLYRAGAWLVVDPMGLRGCSVARTERI